MPGMIYVRFVPLFVLAMLVMASLVTAAPLGMRALLRLALSVLIVLIALAIFSMIVICHCPFFLTNRALRAGRPKR
jgi:hypothetical protein